MDVVEEVPDIAQPLPASVPAANSAQLSASLSEDTMAGDAAAAKKEADAVKPEADAQLAAEPAPAAAGIAQGGIAAGEPAKSEGEDRQAGADTAVEALAAEGEEGREEGGQDGEQGSPGLPPLPETAQLLADSCGWAINGRIEVRQPHAIMPCARSRLPSAPLIKHCLLRQVQSVRALVLLCATRSMIGSQECNHLYELWLDLHRLTTDTRRFAPTRPNLSGVPELAADRAGPRSRRRRLPGQLHVRRRRSDLAGRGHHCATHARALHGRARPHVNLLNPHR